MGLILVDTENKKIEAVTFDLIDQDKEMPICIDFQDKAKDSLYFYLSVGHLEALKRHIDFELTKLKT